MNRYLEFNTIKAYYNKYLIILFYWKGGKCFLFDTTKEEKKK